MSVVKALFTCTMVPDIGVSMSTAANAIIETETVTETETVIFCHPMV